MSRRKYILVGSVSAAAALIAGVLALSLMNGPASGTIKPVQESGPPRGSLDFAGKQYAGTYFKIVHSATYDTSSDTTPDNPRALEQRTLVKELQPGFERVVITIVALEPGGVGEEPSYRLRLSKPEQYLMTDEVIGAHKAVVFTASDLSEVTVYLTHESYVATLAVTSSTYSAKLGDTARELIRSFEWL